MASSSYSLVNAQVSYLDVYKCWLRDNSSSRGDSPIPINVILIGLSLSPFLSTYERQLVEDERTDIGKLRKLFTEIMPAKGEAGFNVMVDILKTNSSEELAKDLLTKCYGPEASNTLSIQSPFSKSKGQAQVHLSRLIKENVDFMAEYWSDIISIAQTCDAFVEVQVVKDFKSTSGIPVNKIREVFEKDEQTIYKRIVIQGDPGCGKTTYINKIALDWAKKDDYLRSKFDFVFLIELKALIMSVDDTIKTFLPKSFRFFDCYTESAESKILLILDGFDELQETSQWYQDVTNLLEGKSTQFQFFNILLTSRRSHIDKIPPKVRGQCLLIKGFNEQSMKQFLIKQDVPLPSVGQESSLSHLLQTPLFCAIYCSLHFGGARDRIELNDSYDLIKALVENSVTNTRKKKTVANVKEQLDEIGKFALQMLDSDSLNFQKMFCRSSEEVINPSFNLSRVNLDLLIKRRIPTRGVGGFKEEFEFSLPHQLIAEYLAARYFARSLTEERLKQADASALTHVFINEWIPDFNCHVLNLPFVRFFLFELLFLYLEKKYEESVFDNLLKIPVLRFIWNCKSNTDIPTLDNVSDLNFGWFDNELRNHSRFIPTLSKCRNLSSLHLLHCGLSKNQVEQLVNFINNNCFQQRLIELDLGVNENVGSTPQLFTALSKCKYLQAISISASNLSVESTTELARCIDNNGLANLRQLYLNGNENVGSSTHLFRVLHKFRQLQRLYLQRCSMTEESLNIFLSTFHSNTFQQLNDIRLWGNEEIKVDDIFFIALETCPKISFVYLSKSMESDLSEVGRKAKDILKERGCRFIFD